jgi:hypothetical protein
VQSGPRFTRVAPKEGIEIVTIKDIGSFTRAQIEMMERVRLLKEEVSKGLDAFNWLTTDVLRTVSAQDQPLIREVAATIRDTYPFKPLPGFQGVENPEDFVHTILYRVLPPEYLNDTMVRAVCLRLVHDYPSTRFFCGVTTSLAAKQHTVPRDTCVRLAALFREPRVGTIVIPVNFGNAHWCAVAVNVPGRVVSTYDPCNHTDYRNALKKLAPSLVSKVTGGFPFTYDEVTTPVQHDLYSCGVFIVWFS